MKFVAPEQAPEQAEIIRNTPFWPDVDLSEFRGMRRWLRFRRNSWTAKVSAFITISTRFTAGHAPCSMSVIRTMTPRRPV